MRALIRCSYVLSLAASLPAGAALAAPGDDPPTPIATDRPVASEPIPFGFDVLPGVGTSSADADRRRVVSLNLIGGLAGGIDAFELGLVFNIDRGLVSGLQLAGLLNYVDADVLGLQWTAAVNIAGGELRGAQLGPMNLVGGRMTGAQLGVIAIADSVAGVQAGVLDVSAGRVAGLQLGVLNVAGGPVEGLQAAVLNVAGGPVDGPQLGVVNVADGDVAGAQIGTLNVADGSVDGLQLGVVNVARRADVGIGLVSVYWDGWSDAEVLASESGLLLAGLRHGSGAMYNVYYVGSRLSSQGSDFVVGLGLGARTDVAPRLELAIDITNLWIADAGTYARTLNVTSLRPHLSWRANHRLALYAGPTFNVEVADAEVAGTLDPLLGDWTVHERDRDLEARLWLGFVAGMRIF